MPNKLPKGWVEERVSDLSIDVSSGGTPNRAIKDYYNGNIAWIKTGEVQDCVINSSEEAITTLGLDNSSAKIFPVGTVLVAMYGATASKLAILDIEASTNQACCGIQVNNKINNKYLYYYLLSKRNDLLNLTAGAGQQNLNVGKIKNFVIQYPLDKKEQEYIVDALDTLSDMIRLRKKGIELSKELIPSIFQEMFGDPIKNDKNWELNTLGDLCDVRDGTHDSPKFINDGYPLITSKNLDDGRISFENVSYLSKSDYNKINERSFVDDGDILYAMIGTIGNPVIVKKDREFAIKNVALFKFPKNKNKVINHYINTLLDVITYDFKQKAVGGNQKFVSLGFLRKYIVPAPPLPLQQEFANKVAEINRNIEAQQSELAHFEELFQSILQKAFTGELTYNFPRKVGK